MTTNPTPSCCLCERSHAVRTGNYCLMVSRNGRPWRRSASNQSTVRASVISRRINDGLRLISATDHLVLKTQTNPFNAHRPG